jgi:hypothetical protein
MMDFTTQEWFYASAYQNQDFINIKTFSGYGKKAVDPDGVQILLPPDASNEDLGKATLAALSKSRIIDISEIATFFDLDNTMKNYNNWVADLMNKYGYKTKRALFKNMMQCSIEIRNGVLTIYPSHHEKLEAWGGDGFTDDDNVVLPINSTAEEIGAGLRLAFSRCR